MNFFVSRSDQLGGLPNEVLVYPVPCLKLGLEALAQVEAQTSQDLERLNRLELHCQLGISNLMLSKLP